ncbi:MAG: phage tail sheath family protein [Deltaproteobacteria bacterium]|nr:phage tail sheath family protein [Deltaproteobacteria bacterium]
MYALLTTNELINMTIPDAAGDVTMSVDQVTEAERNEHWFIILATPPGYTPAQARDWRINTLGITSSYSALYYPYIQIADPVTDLPANIPPGGHIAGVYARTDASKSVGKAPAGTVDGKLLFATGVERKLEFAEIDILHPNQVNAIINTPQTGLVVWGARTLERPPSDFRYVHVRRLFNFLKASIFNSTHGFVFENVGPPLWSKIRLSVESFLLTQFQQGLFKGGTPAEAYAVICDETNNPKNVQDAGYVYCDIYVAPNTPGEFIVFRIQQKVAQAA